LERDFVLKYYIVNVAVITVLIQNINILPPLFDLFGRLLFYKMLLYFA
jgi:hypothetical protein